MPILDSTDPHDVAPILALLIQEAELPAIPGRRIDENCGLSTRLPRNGKLTLWISDPSKIRKTQVFDLTLTHRGWVSDDGALQPARE